jgi:chloramphenicol-sensitive protein RarD
MTYSPAETRKGLLFALACYGTWGLFPAFWKLMGAVAPLDVLAYRVPFSALAVAVLLSFDRRWGDVRLVLARPRQVLVLALAAACLSINWLVFITAVAHGNVLEASMGYFLNPLVNVALGVVVLGERLRRAQWLAVGLAVAGVVYLAVVSGRAPWVALSLALTFGVYGLLRKRLTVSPLVGLAVETGLMTPIALVYLAWRLAQGMEPLGGDWTVATALVASGPVTALPLVWFAAANARLRFATLGFMQYIVPTGHFSLAVLAYGEHPGAAHMVAFGCIWAAIALYSADSLKAVSRPA